MIDSMTMNNSPIMHSAAAAAALLYRKFNKRRMAYDM
jgi:hypothetical protein